MLNIKSYKSLVLTPLFASSLLIAGCHRDNNNDTDFAKRSFDINFSNLTANQPLSPIGVVLHDEGYHAWTDGMQASEALEHLAEGGDNSALITEANDHTAMLFSTSGPAVLGPGSSETFQISADNAKDAKLTLFSMLVRMNDAYTGADAIELSQLEIGESIHLTLPAWDAGTEANSEAVGTIPGISAGEGFNPARDDFLNKVTIHQGIVTSDDGYADSILNQSHRFDNPVAQVTVTRTE